MTVLMTDKIENKLCNLRAIKVLGCSKNNIINSVAGCAYDMELSNYKFFDKQNHDCTLIMNEKNL